MSAASTRWMLALASVFGGLASGATRAQPGDEPPPIVQVEPDWHELFPGQVTNAVECRAAGGRWVTNDKARGCGIKGQQEGVWYILDSEGGGWVSAAVVMHQGKLDGPSVGLFQTGAISERGQFTAGLRSGVWTGFWDNGSLRSTQEWKDDKKIGPGHTYHPNGQPETDESYVDGELDGPFVEWHRSCFKSREGKYVKGLPEGPWKSWTEKGFLLSEGSYAKGLEEGPWKHYHPETGALVEEGSYVAGKRQGKWNEYFVNGQLFRTVEYKDGERVGSQFEACKKIEEAEWAVDFAAREEGCRKGLPPYDTRLGTWTGYYEDAKKRWERSYDNGVLSGEATDWHPTGEILRRGQYKGGIPDGTHEFRGKDGKLFGASTIVKGEGHWKEFWPSGKPREEGEYLSGQMEGQWKWWFENGNPDHEETYVAGSKNGPMKAWFDTGEPKVTGEFARDNRSGYWTAYWTNGRKAWEGAYDEAGNRTGPWKNYYWEGGLKSAGNHLLDDEVGHWIEYYDNGEKRAEGDYDKGKRQGKWQFWWKSGEFWREANYVDGVEQDSGAAECSQAGGQWVTLPEERVTGCQVCRWKPGAEEEDKSGGLEEVAAGQKDGETGPSELKVVDPGAPEGKPPDGTKPTEKAPETPKVLDDTKGHVIRAQDRVWTFWHANGKKEKEGRFKDDEPEGPWTFWYEDGQKMLEGAFKAGKEDGVWTGWYRTGAKRFTGGFADGAEDGAWTTWGLDGKPRSEGAYAKGKKIGKWVYYYAGGAKKDEGSFVDGEESGLWTSFYASGKKRGEGSFEAGRRVGNWTWWREDGSVWRSATYGKDGKETRPGTSR